MPWSPAPSSLLPAASTPCAISADCPWMWHLIAGPLPVKIFLLVADIADRLARHLDQVLAGDRGGPANFAREDDAIGRDQRLDATARFGFGGKEVSTIASEMRSQILSGWPSDTDSLVKTKSRLAKGLPLLTQRGDDAVVVVDAASSDERQAPILDARSGSSRRGRARAGKRYFSDGRSLPAASALASSNRRRRTLGSSIR